MELPPDFATLLLLGAIALVAGFIDAVAGGGGMLVMPALLSIGMPPHLVVGTNKLIGTFGTFSASLTFIRKGLFQPALWRAMSFGTFAGALTGAVLIYLMSAGVLKKLLPLAILLASVYLIWPRRAHLPVITPLEPPAAQPRSVQLTAGGLIGFYDGFIGPGTGAFWMAAAMKLFHLDLVAAAGVARFMNFISNLTALLTFTILGNIDYTIGLSMGALLMCGAFLGAQSAIRYGAPFIRPVFLLVVVLMAGRLLVTG
ncbi:MAG TPA: TSUP family transporter [Candidatus Competibacteraceae bacterium]|nr:TSUP family transporter [Candidatus Competibacteraceae bacterium]MCP5134961.1 TSUP family transporter [Gammaproteobacteria bacterium]HRY17151.1 TSUP family transporter [Candidatus Competibacteraceae bacterium]